MSINELQHPRLEGHFQSVYADVVRRDMDSLDPEESGYYTYRNLADYNRLLPRHNGLTFEETLRQRLQADNTSVAILDLGPGQGISLAEIAKKYPTVHVAGIGATDLRAYAPQHLQHFTDRIDMRLGDIHTVEDIFGDRSFDFIVSVKTFEHLVDPMRVSRSAQKLLIPGGLGFLQWPDHDRVIQPLPQRAGVLLAK